VLELATGHSARLARGGSGGSIVRRNGTIIRVVAAALVATGAALGAFLVAGVQSAAAATSGAVYAWGRGDLGELGNGTTITPQTTPVAVSLPAGVTATAIAGGGFTGYALGPNGTVYAWGFGLDGQLGNGTTTSVQTTPVVVSLPAGVTATAIAAGAQTGYAIGSNGAVYAWGRGDLGELGNGTTTTTAMTGLRISDGSQRRSPVTESVTSLCIPVMVRVWFEVRRGSASVRSDQPRRESDRRRGESS
jgi:Regulator of chromosome condensation (RCC1) repeat